VKPWRIIESRKTFSDGFLTLRTDRCEREAGKIVPVYHVIELSEWATVIALTEEGNIVLVREYRHAAGLVMIGLPGGTADPGETDTEQVARRELSEETGYSPRQMIHVGACYPNPATQNNLIHYYLALGCRRDHAQNVDPNEEIEVLEMPYTEFLRYETLGVQHALHAAGLFYAERFFQKNPQMRP
jgi:8-oxo-dGTP pyrophosphatase MutT (NUDIX family)